MTSCKIILFLVATICTLTVKAQTAISDIVIGHKNVLTSNILNEEREIWVHVPQNLTKDKTTQRYPVVYVLDGDQHFYTVTGMIHQLSATNGNTICPEMIVVGIMNTDRTRDLTITHKTTGFAVDPEFAKNSGGAAKFTAFIEKELFPYIEAHYPTAPHRTLIGHSLGGIMVVNTLLHHTTMFDAYIALDPSLWWDEQLLIRQAQSILQEKKFSNKTFYLAIANTLNSDRDTSEIRKDTHDYTVLLKSQLNFVDLLRANKQNGLRWSYTYFKDESHTTVPLIGEYHALRFIFDFHQFPSFDQLFNLEFDADSALTAHYQNVSAHMGYKVLPPEAFLDGLGHSYLESALLDKAQGVFELNIICYPKSPVGYIAMGDLYSQKGDAQQALSYYQQALSLKGNPEVERKIVRLTSKK